MTVERGAAPSVVAVHGFSVFVPANAVVGQKVSAAGVVSTYSLVYTTGSAYYGGVLAPNGDIHFIPSSATVGQKISTLSKPFEKGVTFSPYLNKF